MKKINLFTVMLVFFIAASTGCGHRSAPLNTAQDEAEAVKASDKSGERGKADDKDGASLSFAPSKEDHVKWLIRNFGILSSGENPLVSKAEAVFERVLAAADKRSNRRPKLVIIREAGDPWVLCGDDGTVVLTQKAMEICYKAADESIGDARAAFMLGHELAHLANDDFWDLAVSEFVHKFAPGQKAAEQIQSLLGKPEALEERKKKELQADDYGLLYASMAGYDPKVIVNSNGKNFFQEWASRTGGEIAYTDSLHPVPEDRGLFLLSRMEDLKKNLILFDLGVRLYQLGMYEDALSFMEAFEKKFPCREVLNNIGLLHYQIGIKALAQSSRSKAYRFMLAAELDIQTRAKTFRGETNKFKEEMRTAVRYFRDACEKDSFYAPARLNLSSALIMAEEYSEAVAILDEALKLRKDDPAALNNKAVAKYLDTRKSFENPDSSEKRRLMLKEIISEESVAALKRIIEQNKEFSDACYNLGRMLTEQNEISEAGKAWNQFLEKESSGVYAEMAEKELEIKKAVSVKKAREFKESPPVKLGGFDKKIENQLKNVSKYPLNLDMVSGEFYAGEDFQALVLENEVELVESAVRQKMTYHDVISEYGLPVRVFTCVSGKKILLYEKFALDIKDNIAVNVLYFNKLL